MQVSIDYGKFEELKRAIERDYWIRGYAEEDENFDYLDSPELFRHNLGKKPNLASEVLDYIRDVQNAFNELKSAN